MHGWFTDEELEQCPRCERRTALTVPQSGMVVCIDCGVVGVRAERDVERGGGADVVP